MKIKNVRREFFRKENNITCVLTYDLAFVNNIESSLYCGKPKLLMDTRNLKAVGKAKCNPEDTFDETTGKRLALNKAHRQMFKDVINVTDKIMGNAFDKLDDIEWLKEKYEIALMRQKQNRNNINSMLCQKKKEIVKEVRIVAPEGCEIDVENSTFECIRFKEKVKKDGKPRSWEEYCEQQEDKGKRGWFYNDPTNVIEEVSWNTYNGNSEPWKDTLPSEALVKKFLAYMQLISLRKAWVGDWEPRNYSDLYVIVFNLSFNSPFVCSECRNSRALSFPDNDMAMDFCNTFRELLFEAKGLY